MAGRYLVSGAQLGMIAGLIKGGSNVEAEKEVHNIIDSCYLWDSDNTLEEDVESIRDLDEPFTLEELAHLRSCPKCGNDDLSIKYVEKGKKYYRADVSEFLKEEPIWDISETKQFYILNQNILFIHCRDCQYDWWEKPLDE